MARPDGRAKSRGRKRGRLDQAMLSPCRAKSRPSRSLSVVTRRPMTRSSTLRMTKDAMPDQPMVHSTPLTWIHTWAALPSIRPRAASPPTAPTANTPVRMAPTMPPTP